MSIRSFLLPVLAAVGVLITVTAQAQDPRYRGGPGYDDPPGGYGDSVECRSSNYAFRRCGVPWRDARLVRQISNTECVRGQTWGVDRGGLWVDRGCAGQFVDAGGGYGGGWYPPQGWDHRFQIRCHSSGYRYGFCAVDLGRGGRAYLQRQESDSACIEGQTCGWNRAGIWVDQGCSGIFTIDRHWR
ncbi:MAG: DUF3011 domain-containing protein [Xanthomonadaceae bacterium]|nr:DUF3011 domain-containing protein [Xanthomonadaceae bacterium]